jgi:hypothetical protein
MTSGDIKLHGPLVTKQALWLAEAKQRRRLKELRNEKPKKKKKEPKAAQKVEGVASYCNLGY